VTHCHVCGAAGPVTTVTRDRLPAMQNMLHRTREHALAATEGAFALAACGACGYAWNTAFDERRLTYDDSYDNAVPSAVMARYYDEIAEYLGRKYDLARGYVVDIGCGDGKFLKALTRVWPECRALGVDPALPGDEVHAGGRVRLVKGVFDVSQLEAAPSIFVCRHVLEHMPDPVGFVQALRAAIGDRPGVPLFAEVPNFEWIVNHGAFWDFCYEHCNYFSESSLRTVFARAGFEPLDSRAAFGSQYRWIEGRAAAGRPAPASDDATWVPSLTAYAVKERAEIDTARQRLAALKSAGAAVAVWGMATKGIVYSLLVDPQCTLIDVSVDINPAKQGCFVPLSGRAIEAPAALTRVANRGARRAAVVVMNPNYVDEIRGMCAAMGLTADFFDASGAPVPAP